MCVCACMCLVYVTSQLIDGWLVTTASLSCNKPQPLLLIQLSPPAFPFVLVSLLYPIHLFYPFHFLSSIYLFPFLLHLPYFGLYYYYYSITFFTF